MSFWFLTLIICLAGSTNTKTEGYFRCPLAKESHVNKRVLYRLEAVILTDQGKMDRYYRIARRKKQRPDADSHSLWEKQNKTKLKNLASQ